MEFFFSDSTSANVGTQIGGGRPRSPGSTFISGQYSEGTITLVLGYLSIGEHLLGNNGDYVKIVPFYGGMAFAGNRFDYPSQTWIVQGSGKIEILEATNYVKGTFECIAPADSIFGIIAPITITEGEFNIKY